MLLYLGIMLAMLSGYYFKVNEDGWKKKLFCIASAAVLIYFAAFRNVTVGADTLQFCKHYEEIAAKGWDYYRTVSGFGGRLEPGFYVLCKLLGYISPHHQLLIIVTSVWSLTAISSFIYKNSKDVVFSFILFVGFQYYAFWLNAMRQVLAISVILFAVQHFLSKKRYIAYAIAVMVACLFHDSAFFALLLMCWIQPTKWLITLALAAGAFGFVFFNRLFDLAAKIIGYSDYIGSEFDSSNYFAGLIKALLSVIILVVMFYSLRGKDRRLLQEDTSVALKRDVLIWLQLATVVLSVLSMRAVILERIYAYYNFFGFILLPEFLAVNERREDENAFKLVLVPLAFAYCAIVLAFRPEWTLVTPYLFFVK